MIDPSERNEMMLVSGVRVILHQFDLVRAFHMVNGTNMDAIGTHHFHVFLDHHWRDHESLLIAFENKREMKAWSSARKSSFNALNHAGSFRQRRQYPRPAPRALVEAREIIFFVRRMHAVVVEREADHDGVHAKHALEVADNRNRA